MAVEHSREDAGVNTRQKRTPPTLMKKVECLALPSSRPWKVGRGAASQEPERCCHLELTGFPFKRECKSPHGSAEEPSAEGFLLKEGITEAVCFEKQGQFLWSVCLIIPCSCLSPITESSVDHTDSFEDKI